MFKNKFLIIFTVFLFSFFVFHLSRASMSNGTIDSTNKYAYSENMGWINFGDTNSTIHITDTELTGYAYSENSGWISLNCSNDNTCSNNNYKVSNTTSGVLSGYAYGENIGWINFSGVTINNSGEFIGYAYNENTGYISFNCSNTNTCTNNSYKVTTDWRPLSQRPVIGGNTASSGSSGNNNNNTNTDNNNNNNDNSSNDNDTNSNNNQTSGDTYFTNGSFVKTNNISTVYFISKDNTRHSYPSEAIWYSYFNKDFTFVETKEDIDFSQYRLGKNVTFKVGTLFKVPSVPKVYLVSSDNGLIRWIKTEDKAIELYGKDWNKLVYDLDESLFSDYTEGEVIE